MILFIKIKGSLKLDNYVYNKVPIQNYFTLNETNPKLYPDLKKEYNTRGMFSDTI